MWPQNQMHTPLCDSDKNADKRSVDYIEHRLREEQFITTLLLRLYGDAREGSEYDANLSEILHEIAELLGFDRCSFWEVHDTMARRISHWEKPTSVLPPLPLTYSVGHYFGPAGKFQGMDGRDIVFQPSAGHQAIAAFVPSPDGFKFALAVERFESIAYNRTEVAILRQLCHILSGALLQRRAQERQLVFERQLELAERKARQIQFAASVVHEISQPLTAIQCNIEAVLRLLKNNKYSTWEGSLALEETAAQIKEVTAVMHKIRALFNKEPPQVEPVSLKSIVKTVVQREEQFVGRGKIKQNFHKPEAMVLGDALQLRQVVTNLLHNAIEATAEHSYPFIKIGVVLVDARWVELTVADNGPGIALTKMDNIFEPFDSTKSSGMGMGLALCQEIVLQHGGRIDATNMLDGGALFKVILPRA